MLPQSFEKAGPASWAAACLLLILGFVATGVLFILSDLENQLTTQIATLRRDVTDLVDEHATRLEAASFIEIDRQAMLLQLQLAAFQKRTFGYLEDVRISALDSIGAGITEIHQGRQQAIEQLQALNSTVGGLAGRTTNLLDTYANLPQNFLASDLWTRSIRPEIACQHEDGTGYGGCMHSRVNALLGEATKAGGVFTQRFPVMVDTFQQTNASFSHIVTEVDTRYFAPRTKKQKILSGIEDAIRLGILAAIHFL